MPSGYLPVKSTTSWLMKNTTAAPIMKKNSTITLMISTIGLMGMIALKNAQTRLLVSGRSTCRSTG